MNLKTHIYMPREGRDFDTCHYLHQSLNFSLKLSQIKTQPRRPKAPSLGTQNNVLKPTQKMIKKVRQEKRHRKGVKGFHMDETLFNLQTH